MSRIKNLSDQILGYSQEVAMTIKQIEKQYEFTTEQAIRVVEIATKNMKVDVLHHIEENMLIYLDDKN